MLNRDSKRPRAWAWRLGLAILLGVGALGLLNVAPALAADVGGAGASDGRSLVGLLLVLTLLALAGVDFLVSLIRRRRYTSR